MPLKSTTDLHDVQDKILINLERHEREKEVREYLVKGMSYKMIATACHPQVRYVTISRIYDKLHVNSKSEAVAKAIRGKIV